jgi:YVTN family beta-propeller protein
MKVDPRLGTELAGYRIEELIGRGGMGAVYLAEDVRLGRKVALKLLSPELAEDERFRERFVRESRMAAGLEHPNIVPIYEAGEADGVLFIAMRYIGGTDLKALIRSEGALESARTLSLLGQVADALDAAHARGLVHRDVKPANVLIAPPVVRGASEHAYLSDFGLTKRASSDSGITATGQFVGTIEYAAPEQFEGKPLDARTDVYSLACVLFECLTGEVPYRRDQDAALMYAHLMAPVPSAKELNPELPPAIDAVISSGMAKASDGRFARAGELVRSAREAFDLPSGELPVPRRAVRAGVPASAAPDTKPPRSRRPIMGLVAVAGLALLATGIALLLTRGGGQTAAPGTSPTGVVGTAAAKAIAVDPKTGRPAGTVGLGKGTGRVAVGFGAVWVANQDDDTVTRIDPTTRKVVQSIHVGHRPTDIAVGEGDPNVWVITSDGVWGIDPISNGVVATIKLTNLPLSVTVAQGFVWITNKNSEQSPEGLFRIDPRTKTVVERIPVSEATFTPSPVDVAVAPDSVWVINPQGASVGFLVRWDLAARKRTGDLRIRTPVALGMGSDAIWALQADGVVLRVDLASRQVVARIATSAGAAAIAVAEDAVWVVNRLQGTITRIDPATNRADPPVDLGGKPSSVAAGEGMVWVRIDGS